MTASTAMRRRSHDTWLTRRYSVLAAELAAAGRWADALACQVMSDTHRVSAVLWSRASVSHDTVGTYFELASQVMSTVVDIAPSAVAPADSLRSLRAAFEGALEDFNLPINFTTPAWIATAPDIAPDEWARSTLGSSAWPDAVESMLLRGSEGPAADRPALCVMAYLVKVAGSAGDLTMMSAVARWLLISSEEDPQGGVTLLDAAKKVLGPVEWVRMEPLRALLGL